MHNECMHALLVAYEDGKTRRCDAACRNARSDECHCICGGLFHGVGTRAGRVLMEALARDPDTLPGLDVQVPLFA
jgi:hypothetical protein